MRRTALTGFLPHTQQLCYPARRMSPQQLPSDDQFLDGLYVAPEDYYDPTENPDFLNESVAVLKAAKDFPAETRSRTVRSRNVQSTQEFPRGS